MAQKWTSKCQMTKNGQNGKKWPSSTVWKLHDFSVTQILREINSWEF